jgi:hypothetical protein
MSSRRTEAGSARRRLSAGTASLEPIGPIGGGTDEVMRDILGKQLGL